MIELIAKVTGIAANLAGICGTFYAIAFVWRSFIKRKRIENASADASQALSLLTEVESALEWLAMVTTPGKQFSAQEVSQAHFQAFASLNRLGNALLLLQTNPELSSNLEGSATLVQALIKLLKTEDKFSFQAAEALGILDKNWAQEGLGIRKLEELRQILLRIYALRNSEHKR
jgi:hypothetical protein